MIQTIIIFIIILGILVFVHEFGHFWVAKKTGMAVDEFGFGFPPRIAGIQKIAGKLKMVWGHKPPLDPQQTVYSINWIPFGGFVKIRGENNEYENDPRSFINRPFWARLGTLVAGVTMNWILAAVLFSAVLAVGTTAELTPGDPILAYAAVSSRQVAISYIQDGGPAQKAGLQQEDIILSVDGQTFTSYEPLQQYILSHKGQTFEFVVKRFNETEKIDVPSLKSPAPDEGPTGIALTDIGTIRLPWYRAIIRGTQEAVLTTQAIAAGVYQIFTSKAALKSVGGPVAIGRLVGQVRQVGIVALIRLTALLSLSLAVLNILPIPALDGGRVLFLIIEKIRRKKNNQKIEQFVNTAGFVLLIMLMVVVTIKDIMKK